MLVIPFKTEQKIAVTIDGEERVYPVLSSEFAVDREPKFDPLDLSRPSPVSASYSEEKIIMDVKYIDTYDNNIIKDMRIVHSRYVFHGFNLR